MHPMTIYDMAVREHERATAERLREHLLALRLREQADRLPRHSGSHRRTPRSVAGGARPASSVGPAAA